LTPNLLATVRYAKPLAFDQVADSLRRKVGPISSTDIFIDSFIDLIESIVDVAADRIENIAGELSTLSQAVFSQEGERRRGLLRASLFKVGNMQRQINQIRSALLGVSRVVIYLCDAPTPFISKTLQSQLKVIHADIGSLNEFHQQMREGLQFLLDAVLGFINNDQNDIMRVLTIVSVATVPPMILAGIWGMNFKSIPEYSSGALVVRSVEPDHVYGKRANSRRRPPHWQIHGDS
jgi:magnesium transporter